MVDGGQATTSDNDERNGYGETPAEYWQRRFNEVCVRWDEAGNRALGLTLELQRANAAVDEARRQRTTEIVAALRAHADHLSLDGADDISAAYQREAADMIERGDIAP
jgi:hypothetical protein